MTKGRDPLTRVAPALGPFYHIKTNFGAVGDGVADDAAAFQAAFDLFKYSSGTRGGRIIVPAGTYNIGTGLLYEGDFGHSFVMQGDTQGENASTDGPVLRYTGKAFTADAGTDVITSTAHGYSTDQAVVVSSTGTLPAPLVVGTTYYVRDVTTNTFKLAATVGGVAIDLTSAGTGTHSISSAGGILLLMKGANWCRFEDIQFTGNGLALTTVALRFDSVRTVSSFDCGFYNCGFGGAVGTDSTLLQFGPPSASAEHNVVNCRFIGYSTAGTTYYGITGAGGNSKNYTVESSEFIGLRWGLALGDSGFHRVVGCSFASNTIGDIKPSNDQLSVRDCGSEGSAKFIDRAGANNLGTLTMEGCYWAGITVTDDFIIDYAGQLTLIGNSFSNNRAPTLKAFTVDTGTDVLTSTAHGLSDRVRVNVSSTGTLPAPLVAQTNYYTRDTAANTLKLSLTEGGTAIDITTTGSGTHSVYKPIEPAIKSGLGITGGAISGSVVSLNNAYLRPSGTPPMPYVPIYDSGNNLTTSTFVGAAHDGFSGPTNMRGQQLLSFGDKSRPVDADTDVNFPPRITAHLTYLMGISTTAIPGKNLRGSVAFSSSDTATVTFNAAEPDALYFVAISGNAAEAFWVTSKATTGFTMRSSNPTSTATCDWILVR